LKKEGNTKNLPFVKGDFTSNCTAQKILVAASMSSCFAANDLVPEPMVDFSLLAPANPEGLASVLETSYWRRIYLYAKKYSRHDRKVH
jgi:hypothetical protein